MASNKSIVYRSRINVVTDFSDSDKNRKFSLEDIDSQYTSIGSVDDIDSRTFDESYSATAFPLRIGLCDFSNTINRFDENAWSKDSDGYGHNMLGSTLDFENEIPGNGGDFIDQVGNASLTSLTSTVAGFVTLKIFNSPGEITSFSNTNGLGIRITAATGNMQSRSSTSAGIINLHKYGSGDLKSGPSSFSGNSRRRAEGDIIPGRSSIKGTGSRAGTLTGTVESRISDASGLGGRLRAGSGTFTVEYDPPNSYAISGTGSYKMMPPATGTLESELSGASGSGGSYVFTRASDLVSNFSTVSGLSSKTVVPTVTSKLLSEPSIINGNFIRFSASFSASLTSSSSLLKGLGIKSSVASAELKALPSRITNLGGRRVDAHGELRSGISLVVGTVEVGIPYVFMPDATTYTTTDYVENVV
jgi:hypothetical protein